MRISPAFVLAAAILFAPLNQAIPAPISEKSFAIRPKLVVVIAVDQMRADYLTRFRSRFLEPELPGGKPGGFRYLMARGAYFPFAQYDVLHSMTGPGHAMILSGSYPYQMGDRKSSRLNSSHVSESRMPSSA